MLTSLASTVKQVLCKCCARASSDREGGFIQEETEHLFQGNPDRHDLAPSEPLAAPRMWSTSTACWPSRVVSGLLRNKIFLVVVPPGSNVLCTQTNATLKHKLSSDVL